MKLTAIFTAIALSALSLSAAKPVIIPLWPDGAPTKNGLEGQKDHYYDKDSTRIGNISVPELWVYPAKKPNGMAIICAPGGGYRYISSLNEGTSMAQWMNNQGITFAVLKYRMPNGHKEVPLEDGRRAIQVMREHAKEYGFNPNEVGIMGSSAGGHFAATLATMYGDKESRPDFQILFYPVISMTEITHSGSRDNLLGKNPTAEEIEKYSLENRVDAQTPPAFIVLAMDDRTVDPMNSLNYVSRLQANKVPYALHIYPNGGHGFGYTESFPYKAQLIEEIERWLRKIHEGR